MPLFLCNGAHGRIHPLKEGVLVAYSLEDFVLNPERLLEFHAKVHPGYVREIGKRDRLAAFVCDYLQLIENHEQLHDVPDGAFPAELWNFGDGVSGRIVFDRFAEQIAIEGAIGVFLVQLG